MEVELIEIFDSGSKACGRESRRTLQVVGDCVDHLCVTTASGRLSHRVCRLTPILHCERPDLSHNLIVLG